MSIFLIFCFADRSRSLLARFPNDYFCRPDGDDSGALVAEKGFFFISNFRGGGLNACGRRDAHTYKTAAHVNGT